VSIETPKRSFALRDLLSGSADLIFAFAGKRCVSTFGADYPDDHEGHMVKIWSSESIVQCMLQAFQESDSFSLLVTPKDLPAMAEFLSTKYAV
jgi:hypothetical protein